MTETVNSTEPWRQLQARLWQLLALARKQDKFPATIPLLISSRTSCEKALERYPLEQWLATGPDEIQASVIEWHKNIGWADSWSIYFITPPGESVDEFVKRKQEQDNGLARERQQELTEHINRPTGD